MGWFIGLGVVVVIALTAITTDYEKPISPNFYIEGAVVPDSVPPKMRFKVHGLYEKHGPIYGTFDTREEAVAWVKEADVLMTRRTK